MTPPSVLPSAPPSASPLPPGATALGLPDAWLWTARADDVDLLADAQPHWRMRYEQLSDGPFDGELRHAQLPGLRLVMERSGRALRQRGELGHGAYGFAMSLLPAAPAIFNGQRAAHHAVMLGRSDELDMRTPDAYVLIAAVVDSDLLAPLWERMYQKPLPRWLDTQLVVPVKPAAADALRSFHLQALTRLWSSPTPPLDDAALLQLRDAVLIEWIATLPEAVDTLALPTAAARKRLVDRVCERVLDTPDAPPSMLELCRCIGVSRRKLNYCFLDVLGTSPVKYLRAVRLNGVRRELRQGKGTGQDVAARWGFWHLGQFSTDYKRQFGELPSATMKGARARVPGPGPGPGERPAEQECRSR